MQLQYLVTVFTLNSSTTRQGSGGSLVSLFFSFLSLKMLFAFRSGHPRFFFILLSFPKKQKKYWLCFFTTPGRSLGTCSWRIGTDNGHPGAFAKGASRVAGLFL